MNKNINDLDFVINFDIAKFSSLYKSFFKEELTVRDKFLTASVSPIANVNIDFVQVRKEYYPINGALPEVEVGDFNTDYLRRDFTINTLKVSLSNYLHNNINLIENVIAEDLALSDLQNLLIRVLHKDSFLNDPTRIFRAIRYKNKIRGKFEESTATFLNSAIKNNALKTISNYRILQELIKICMESSFKHSISDIISLKINLPYFDSKKLEILSKNINSEKENSNRDILYSISLVLEEKELLECFKDLMLKKSLKKEILAERQ